MARHKPAAGPLDVKLIDGGLVDLEFCVHVAQLRYGEGLDTGLDRAIVMLADAGRLPAGLAEAQLLLTRMLVTLRLVAPGCDEPSETARRLVARACGVEDWASLMSAYERARADVGQCWHHVVAEAEEMR
jgi:glutamate-ammonia-ligase adenylyltransferase